MSILPVGYWSAISVTVPPPCPMKERSAHGMQTQKGPLRRWWGPSAFCKWPAASHQCPSGLHRRGREWPSKGIPPTMIVCTMKP